MRRGDLWGLASVSEAGKGTSAGAGGAATAGAAAAGAKGGKLVADARSVAPLRLKREKPAIETIVSDILISIRTKLTDTVFCQKIYLSLVSAPFSFHDCQLQISEVEEMNK